MRRIQEALRVRKQVLGGMYGDMALLIALVVGNRTNPNCAMKCVGSAQIFFIFLGFQPNICDNLL